MHMFIEELDGFFEGTRREMSDMGMVWVDVSDDDPSGFTACGLYGFGANIVGRVELDGSTSRRVLLTPMIDDDVVSPRDVYQAEGYMTAQLDADSARRVGQALIDAADEIDSLGGENGKQSSDVLPDSDTQIVPMLIGGRQVQARIVRKTIEGYTVTANAEVREPSRHAVNLDDE
jgi:hypothetical protein